MLLIFIRTEIMYAFRFTSLFNNTNVTRCNIQVLRKKISSRIHCCVFRLGSSQTFNERIQLSSVTFSQQFFLRTSSFFCFQLFKLLNSKSFNFYIANFLSFYKLLSFNVLQEILSNEFNRVIRLYSYHS